MYDDQYCRVEGGDSEGARGRPARRPIPVRVLQRWIGQSGFLADQNSSFPQLRRERQREDFSDLSTRGCLQIPDGGNEEKDFSQWPCRALDPGRGLTSGSAGSSLNTLCSSCTSNVLLIQPLPPLPPSVLWLSPSAYFVLHDTGTSVSSLSALMLFCCKPVSPICSTNRAFAAWFTVTAPLPGLYKASHSKHVLHSRKLHNTRPWMIYAEKGSLPVSKKTTFLGGVKHAGVWAVTTSDFYVNELKWLCCCARNCESIH